MDCVSVSNSQLDLKLEDNADYCLINSFLGFERQDGEERFMDDLIEDAPLTLPNPPARSNSIQFIQQIVNQAASYICFRTTSLHDIMDYLQKYYRVPLDMRKHALAATRRLKLRLKRSHAKQRNNNCQFASVVNSLPQPVIDIKVEESQLQPFVFDNQSQETKKKKRNRMSAQNSRDRKKEYIRQIQNQNKELKKKLVNFQQKHQMPASSKDFLKLVLCLGITCYANIHLSTSLSPTQQKIDTGNQLNILIDDCFKFPKEVEMLASWQQKAISQLMQNIGETQTYQDSAHFQCAQLIEEVISEKSTSSEGDQRQPKSQFC